MAEHLKIFNTTAEYESVVGTENEPSVSHVIESNGVEFKKDPYGGHEYVDLGLPSGTKWATMNIGASSVTDYGTFYQYGKGLNELKDTSGDTTYSGTENPLAASADTAVQVWGGSWHLPTKAQFEELTANTNYTYIAIDGINCGKFTLKTDSSKYIIFPAGGYFDVFWGQCVRRYENSMCYYWSSTPSYALYSGGNSPNHFGVAWEERTFGYPIRPVVG